MTPPTQPDIGDAWKTVTHRRRPTHFLPSPCPPPKQTTALSPFAPTYAQVLLTKPTPPHPIKSAMSALPNLPNNPVGNSNHQTKPSYIASPHSPVLLRYPPSPHYTEWWGCCFRCTKTGHIVAECKYPKFIHTPTQQSHLPELSQPKKSVQGTIKPARTRVTTQAAGTWGTSGTHPQCTSTRSPSHARPLSPYRAMCIPFTKEGKDRTNF